LLKQEGGSPFLLDFVETLFGRQTLADWFSIIRPVFSKLKIKNDNFRKICDFHL